MSYSGMGMIALIIHLIINHDVLRKSDGKEEIIPAHRSYRAFLICITVYYCTDILWGLLYERKLIALTYADTTLYFVAMACSILLWTRFVIHYLKQQHAFGKALSVAGCLIFALQMVTVIVNFFRPIMFSFDASGVYHAEKARYIVLIAQIAMFLMTAVYAAGVAMKSKGTVGKRHRTIGLFSAAMAGFVTGQAFYPLLPLYAVGCLLGSCVLHSFVLEDEKEEYRDDLEEQLRESIEKGNSYDLLTGLPSMTYFFELADAGKEAIRQKGGQPALLYMDFNGMRFFNKKHGFAEGDKLLQAFAKLLIRYFGNENCCRIGADHFAVITVKEGLENRLYQIFHECQDMNHGNSLPVHVGIYSQEDDLHASVACDRAKLACGELRGAYASCFNYFSQELSDDAEKKQYIIENIDRAISEKWIKVYYQPIVRATTRMACEEEALSRWIDPAKGFLSPADFIPALEDSGLIYRLDLYVLEQVLEKIRRQTEQGLVVVPHSINLSRSDFDACDIVEEIRKRVDDAGIERDRITVEITESVIGSDFDFIREQVTRFRKLGFPVWIDDFGSGYSSLDVLQSLKFDLIKFDMGFMRKLDEGEKGKIILTELMQMATSLGVDTICEGVETERQVLFLQEIGCSKLQGYYFSKPVPYEGAPGANGKRFSYENPMESPYYDMIDRVNLYDLTSIVNEDENAFQNFFNTLPMSIIEAKDQKAQYVRSNQSYRDFMKRHFGIDLTNSAVDFAKSPDRYGMSFIRVIRQCCTGGNRAFFDEKLPDGSTVHCFVRRVSQNAVNGRTAIAIAVLSITDPDEGASYADIARALAADYYNIYIVDLDTGKFIEYTSPVGKDELAVERHGTDFFESARRDTMTRIYEEDRKAFLTWFSKENIIRELDERGVFTTTYRLIDSGAPMYANMKITRMHPGGNRIILGVSLIDAHGNKRGGMPGR